MALAELLAGILTGPIAHGRAEPGGFLVARPWLLLILVFMMRAEFWRLRWSVGVLGMLLAVAGEALLLGAFDAAPSATELLRQAGAALLMLLALDLMVQVGQLVWLRAGGLIAALCAAAAVVALEIEPVALTGRSEASVENAALRPALAVVTGLPLIWGEGDIRGMLSGKRRPTESWRWLDRNFALSVLDRIDTAALEAHSLLLLAQPRALAPEELVAIDKWVRRGGRVLVLADPSLRWPSLYPPTDPRAPPAVSLLDPLLDHWGLRLDLLELHGARDLRTIEISAAGRQWRLAVSAPGRFAATRKACKPAHDGLLARCAIGRGRAVLIADADLMADTLWVVERGNGAAPEDRIADNPVVVGILLDELAGISRDRTGEWVPWIGRSGMSPGPLLAGAAPGLISLSLAFLVAFVRRRSRV